MQEHANATVKVKRETASPTFKEEVLDERASPAACKEELLSDQAVAAAPGSGVFIAGAILVSGNTFAVKETLNAIGGGSWVKTLDAWVFPEAKRAAILAALPGCGTSTPLVRPSVNANANVDVSEHKRAIIVTGDTTLVKDRLRTLRGSWNRALQGWIFPKSSKEEVLALLQSDPTNTVTEGGRTARTGKPSAREDDAKSDSDDEPLLKRKVAKSSKPTGTQAASSAAAACNSDDEPLRKATVTARAASVVPAGPPRKVMRSAKATVTKRSAGPSSAVAPEKRRGRKRAIIDYAQSRGYGLGGRFGSSRL